MAPATLRNFAVEECQSDHEGALLCQAVFDVIRVDGQVRRAPMFFSVKKEANAWVATPTINNREFK